VGEGVVAEETWPAILAGLLRSDGLGVAALQVVAATGWTTDELAAALTAAAPRGPFDLVSLLIGVNNQYRGLSLDDYRTGFHALLERAIRLTGGDPARAIVLSIPDWGATPFAAGRDRAAIAREIDAFNQSNREETDAAGARYVDVTALSRELSGEHGMLTDDALHPSAAQYRRWAQLVHPVARLALPSPP
jgi:lysophospholipase L1-like esterase